MPEQYSRSNVRHGPKEFLMKGTCDQRQGSIPEELLREFDIRLMELAGEEMGAWLLNGNGG